MTGSGEVVNIGERFTRFDQVWSPKVIAEANGWHLKLVKARGLFVWHRHDVDEIFLVEHRPDAGDGCEMMLLEPAGVITTGDAGGPRTAVDEWLTSSSVNRPRTRSHDRRQ